MMERTEVESADSLGIILSSQEPSDLDLFSTAAVVTDSEGSADQEESCNVIDLQEASVETAQQFLCVQSVSEQGTLILKPAEESQVQLTLNTVPKINYSQPAIVEEVQHVKYHLVYNPQTKTICLASTPVLTTNTTKCLVKSGTEQTETIKIINGTAAEQTSEESTSQLDVEVADDLDPSSGETTIEVANSTGPQTSKLGMILTHWPLGNLNEIFICNFHTDFSDWWLGHLLWHCPTMNVTGLH